MWEEFLDADTFAKGKGSTVGKVLEGDVVPQRVTGIASVLNPGLDRNWCGHHFSQANWYASGRLAWNPELSARADRRRMDAHDVHATTPAPVKTIVDLMMASREAFVNYTMPLGLHHLIGGNHYAPMPQNAKAPRADWTATYYHQASTDGIGFDRTMRGQQGRGAVLPAGARPVRQPRDLPGDVPALVPSSARGTTSSSRARRSGKGCARSTHEGARQALAMQATWDSLADASIAQRHKEVADRLAIQVADAQKWRDEILQVLPAVQPAPDGHRAKRGARRGVETKRGARRRSVETKRGAKRRSVDEGVEMTRTWSSRLAAAVLVTAGIAAFTLTVDTRARVQSGPKRPAITGVAAFAAKVASMEEARTFYSTVLGLEEAFTIRSPVGGRT